MKKARDKDKESIGLDGWKILHFTILIRVSDSDNSSCGKVNILLKDVMSGILTEYRFLDFRPMAVH